MIRAPTVILVTTWVFVINTRASTGVSPIPNNTSGQCNNTCFTPTNNRNNYYRTINNRNIDNRSTNNIIFGKRSINNRSTNNKSINNRSINNRSINNRSINNRSIKNRSIDNRSIDNRSINNTSISNRSIKNRSINNGNIKKRSKNNRNVINRSINKKSINNRRVYKRSTNRSINYRNINRAVTSVWDESSLKPKNKQQQLYEAFFDQLSVALRDFLFDRDLNLNVWGMKVNLRKNSDDLVKVTFGNGVEESARGKKKSKLMGLLPFALLPAFIFAGVVPWILPVLKLAAMFAGMLNNFVFMQALFTLARNYVFNPKKEEHVIYLNHGYHPQKHEHHPPYPPPSYGHNR